MTTVLGALHESTLLLAQSGGAGDLLKYTIFGLVLAAIYFIAASGLVVTYTTSGMFNFAHGAVGMIGAFTYWQFVEKWGWPVVPSLLLILLVVAPALGLAIERLVMRRLEGVSEATKMVVSIGLLFFLIKIAPAIWGPKNTYQVQPFFNDRAAIELFGAGVTYHQLITIGIAVLVGIALRFILFGTRLGVSMRAVVDNRSLAQLNGAKPSRVSGAAWGLGSSLAALAGILIAERIVFDGVSITFLVVNAYAAAVIGRLSSLPRTLVGAIVIGLAQSYTQGYLTTNPEWLTVRDIDIVTNFRAVVPMVILIIVLLLVPQARLRAAGIQRSRESVPLPKVRPSLIGCAVLIGGTAVVAFTVSGSNVTAWSQGIALGIIMLSLVPLMGYAGQVSLAQMSFAGIGAYAVATYGDGSPVGLLVAVVFASIAGVVVALPALRLQGIYLALATLAFAFIVEKFVFTQPALFPTTSKKVSRLNLFGLSLDDNRTYMVFLSVVFAALAMGIVVIRRGVFGRRLQAMKDSPAACATLGLNLTRTKLQVFALSSAIAGLGGALFAGVNRTASTADYAALQNLPILLMASAGGIALCSGALVGGLLLGSFALGTKSIPSMEILGVDSATFFTTLFACAPGLIGIALGRNPNGLVPILGDRYHQIMGRRGAVARGEEVEERRSLLPVDPVLDVEALGLQRDFTAADVEAVERVVKADIPPTRRELSHAAP